MPSAPAATSHAAATAAATQVPPTTAATDTTGMQAVVAAVLSVTSGGDTASAASAGKGDDVFAIAGVKTSPSDLAPRPAIAAGAAGAAGAAVPVGQAGNAGLVGSAGATEDADGDATASVAPPNAGAVAPTTGSVARTTGAAAPPNIGVVAPGQFAELPAVDTDPTDTTTKTGLGRLAEDGGAVADSPHATAAAANATVNVAASVLPASSGLSAAAPANNRAGAVPLAEVAVTIAAQARSGKSRFDIRLDPPELGRIDVQLNVDNGGNVSSRLIVERPETLDLLRRDAPELERALQDAGLNTGNGMQFSLADQGFASRNGLADYAVRAPLFAGADVPAPVPLANGYAAAAHRGGLDITV